MTAETEIELTFLQWLIFFELLFIGLVTTLYSLISLSFVGIVGGVGTSFSAYLFERDCLMRERVDL